MKRTEEKLDLHKVKAAELFNVEYEQVTTKQRNFAKVVNHAYLYGMLGAQPTKLIEVLRK